MFVDKTKVYIKAGNGGNGCMSFLREKYVAKGGPNGGDGGNGGSVIIRACSSQQSLVDLRLRQHVDAKSGGPGLGKDRHGANAEDRIVLVPPGTLIMDIENDHYVVADLVREGDEILVALGGKGGHGNSRFMTSTNRAPRRADPGELGEERILLLELKSIADVGLVGYPNAGKSSFLTACTEAHPKVASYPFTTLDPHVGILEFDDYSRITIADIPGLIDGASENIGLGHAFLRHIERTKVLAYVLDMAGTDNRDPLDDLMHLRNELELYKEGLSDRSNIILANKMDEDGAEENLKKLREAVDFDIIPMSAGLNENTDEAIATLRKLVEEHKDRQAEELKDLYRKQEFVTVDLEADDFGLEEDKLPDFDLDDEDWDDEDWESGDNVIYVSES